MFYAAHISASQQSEPPRFDPLLGKSPTIRHVSSGQVCPGDCVPRFIDMGGRRSTVTGWRSTLRVALRAARQEVPNLAALSDLCGLDLKPGRGHPNASFDPDLDASVPSLSSSGNAKALFRLLDGLGLGARIRVSSPLGDLLVDHKPRAYRAAAKPARPAPTHDNLIEAARRGEAAYGSFVEISIEGLFERRIFRLGDAGADPRRGELSVSSPVGRSLIGHMPGAETEYQAGPSRRGITLHAVDNRHVLRGLMKVSRSDPDLMCEN